MLLDLTRFRRPSEELDRTLQPADLPQEGEAYRVVAPAHLVCEIHKDHTRFRLTGSVTSELELDCSRCLEPFRVPVNMTFDHRYLPHAEVLAGEKEQEVEEDDMETSFYQDDQIDLAELVREQFYLALPMKPLCVEHCKGLCPQCGTNLNLSVCGCKQVWGDPRLAALKSMSTHDA